MSVLPPYFVALLPQFLNAETRINLLDSTYQLQDYFSSSMRIFCTNQDISYAS